MRKPSFVVPSRETGTDYCIHVRKPDAPPPWTALVVLDGDDLFTTAVKAHRAQANPAPLLIVGVGYGGSSPAPINQRVRDYTPVRVDGESASGGADAFLSFLTNTLWPELLRRYAINDEIRALAGYSLGALFVLHALFHSRPFFTHHLAGSPSIWWGDAAILTRVKEIRAVNPDLRGKLFLSVGDKDSQSMTGNLARLEIQLGALGFPNLDLSVRRLRGKNHKNAMPATLAAGLTALF